MKKILIWAILPFLFLSFYGIQLGVTYRNSHLDCKVLKEDNRKEWMQCSRKKRVADRNIRRFWNGY